MNDQESRLPEDPREPELEALLDEARKLTAWPAPARAHAWARIVSQAGAPTRRQSWLAPVAAGAVLIVLLGIAALLRSPKPASDWRTLEIEGTGELAVQADAEIRVPPAVSETAPERQVFLDKGTVRARVEHQPPGKSFAVVTPHLKVTVVGTRFSVSVWDGMTSVAVEQGKVRVARDGRAGVHLGPGDSIRSDDLRLEAKEPIAGAAPDPTPSLPAHLLEPAEMPPARRSEPSDHHAARRAADSAERCDQEPTVSRRRSCYLTFATDEGLSGQNAVYSLGRLESEAGAYEKAIEYWSMYSRRFPDGVFAPEISVNLVSARLALGRNSEAREEAERFLKRYPADPRHAEIGLVRARLLCAAGRIAEARAAIDQIPADETGETLFARASCEIVRGDEAVGLAGLKQYLAAYPRGAHAREAEALLDKAGESPATANSRRDP